MILTVLMWLVDGLIIGQTWITLKNKSFLTASFSSQLFPFPFLPNKLTITFNIWQLGKSCIKKNSPGLVRTLNGSFYINLANLFIKNILLCVSLLSCQMTNFLFTIFIFRQVEISKPGNSLSLSLTLFWKSCLDSHLYYITMDHIDTIAVPSLSSNFPKRKMIFKQKFQGGNISILQKLINGLFLFAFYFYYLLPIDSCWLRLREGASLSSPNKIIWWVDSVSEVLKENMIRIQKNISSKRIEQLFSVFISITIYLNGKPSQKIFRVVKILCMIPQ